MSKRPPSPTSLIKNNKPSKQTAQQSNNMPLVLPPTSKPPRRKYFLNPSTSLLTCLKSTDVDCLQKGVEILCWHGVAKTSDNLILIQEDLFRGRFEDVERKVMEMEKGEKKDPKGITKEEKKVTNDSGPFCFYIDVRLWDLHALRYSNSSPSLSQTLPPPGSIQTQKPLQHRPNNKIPNLLPKPSHPARPLLHSPFPPPPHPLNLLRPPPRPVHSPLIKILRLTLRKPRFKNPRKNLPKRRPPSRSKNIS